MLCRRRSRSIGSNEPLIGWPLPYHPKGHDHAYQRHRCPHRAAAGLAVAAAAALAAPAFAAAEPTTLVPPTLETAVDGNVVTVTLTNPNLDPLSGCTAVAIDSAKVPALMDDPTKFLEPGFVSWTSGVDGATADRPRRTRRRL